MLTSDASGNASWQTLPPATLSGGTNGRVTYWTGTGTVAAGTNLAWDNANNRLGIGTTTPSVALDVKTTTGFIANLEMYSNTTSAALSIGSSVGSSPGNFNALPSGSVLGTINLRGTNGTAFRIGAAITSQAEEGWTASRNGASLRFQTTENTTNALQTRMTINHDGNVGIGTTDPTWKLDIRNPTATNDDVCMGLWNDRANWDAIIRLHTLAGAEDVGIFLDETDGRKLKFALGDVATDANLQNNTRITITQTGRVGIGTTDPRVPLDVQGFNDLTSSSFAFYARVTAPGPTFGDPFTGEASGLVPVGIRSNSRIWAVEFNATSDARVKRILARPEPQQQLAELRRLQVTQYKYLDSLQHGTAPKTGFIAQEVEQVLPDAVHRNTDYIPNVMQYVAQVAPTPDSTGIAFRLAPGHGLQAGDRVRIYAKAGTQTPLVTAVDGAHVTVEKWDGDLTEGLFVYGKEVNDFRTIDYDRLFTAGIGAIQALDHQQQRTTTRLDKLETAQAADSAELKALLQQLLEQNQALRQEVEALKTQSRTAER